MRAETLTSATLPTPTGRNATWRLVLNSACVARLAMLAGGCATAVRDDSGSVTEAGTESVLELRVSDCLDEPDDFGTDEEEVTEVVDVRLVPCSEPHDSEVYATFELPEGPYPGDDEIAIAADERCLKEFEPFVGLPYEESALDLYTYAPTQDSWGFDRVVTCQIGEPFTQTTGSLRGAAR